MESLELLDRSKVSVEWPGIRLSIHTRKVGALVVGPRIGQRACGRRSCSHVGEGVHQVRELSRNPILLEVRYVVPGIVNTPFFEIPAKNLVVLCEGRNYGCDENQEADPHEPEGAR